MFQRKRSILALALSIAACLLNAAPKTKHLALPANARIEVTGKTIGNAPSDAEMCKAYSVTRQEVRRYFATYHVIDAHENHYLYQHAPCSIEGTVTLHGTTFPRSINPGGTLGTTYPDGVQKTSERPALPKKTSLADAIRQA